MWLWEQSSSALSPEHLREDMKHAQVLATGARSWGWGQVEDTAHRVLDMSLPCDGVTLPPAAQLDLPGASAGNHPSQNHAHTWLLFLPHHFKAMKPMMDQVKATDCHHHNTVRQDW